MWFALELNICKIFSLKSIFHEYKGYKIRTFSTLYCHMHINRGNIKLVMFIGLFTRFYCCFSQSTVTMWTVFHKEPLSCFIISSSYVERVEYNGQVVAFIKFIMFSVRFASMLHWSHLKTFNLNFCLIFVSMDTEAPWKLRWLCFSVWWGPALVTVWLQQSKQRQLN